MAGSNSYSCCRAMRQEGIFSLIRPADGSAASAVRRVFVVLSLVAAMWAVMPLVGSAATTTSPGHGQPGRFEPLACSKIRVHFGGRVIAVASIPALKAARCGYLVVPENRRRPAGRTIRLAV